MCPPCIRAYMSCVCACEAETREKVVQVGTGTKSIIIAVRITPTLHTEQSSLPPPLYLSLSLTPPPPFSKLSQAVDCSGGDTPQYILCTPHSFFQTARCPAVAYMLNRAEKRGRMGAGEQGDLRGPFKQRPAG